MTEYDYDKEYHEIGNYNISRKQYVRQCKEAKLKQMSAEENFVKNVPLGRTYYIFSLETVENPDHLIKRTIVIDGANIMHCGSDFRDNRYNTAKVQYIPDVMALLAVCRYFVAYNFEVICVISQKYYMANTTNYKTAIDELVEMKICVVANQTNLDDCLALEVAATLNGVVVTSDLFRDHQNTHRYQNMVEMHRLGIEWKDVQDAEKFTRTRDGHFVANKLFDFKMLSGMLYRDNKELYEVLYSNPETDRRFEISYHHRNRNWSENRRAEVLEVLNRLIVDGIEICPENQRRIQQEPIHQPKVPVNEFEDEDDDEEEW
ncbi:unnamed protein product [Caenorhabditis angaria]|uniref:RNase NYN domain-containing protein n=1 Tax=Caenorhabditis angaria TaxID=860376 RepID=A0A9P1N3E8_9PELO|nr:unnamed protein product [Caenorhabditis angaria]